MPFPFLIPTAFPLITLPRLKILLFAGPRDVVGQDFVEVDSDLPVTAQRLLHHVGVAHPALAPWLPSCRLAVDQTFVSNDYLVAPQTERETELALIPPVSGG